MSKPKEKKNPVPQGKYVPATRYGNLINTAGMTPRDNGVLIQKGRIQIDQPVDVYKEAVRQSAANALTAARNLLAEGERFEGIVSLSVYLNAEDGFEAHAALADFASEYLYEQLGDTGIGSRAAIGVASLPGGAPVEIQLVAAVSAKESD